MVLSNQGMYQDCTLQTSTNKNRHSYLQIATKQPFLLLGQQFVLLLHGEFELHGRFADGGKILPDLGVSPNGGTQ